MDPGPIWLRVGGSSIWGWWGDLGLFGSNSSSISGRLERFGVAVGSVPPLPQGTTFDLATVRLSDVARKQYDDSCELWRDMRRMMELACEQGLAKKTLRAEFWAAQQRPPGRSEGRPGSASAKTGGGEAAKAKAAKHNDVSRRSTMICSSKRCPHVVGEGKRRRSRKSETGEFRF